MLPADSHERLRPPPVHQAGCREHGRRLDDAHHRQQSALPRALDKIAAAHRLDPPAPDAWSSSPSSATRRCRRTRSEASRRSERSTLFPNEADFIAWKSPARSSPRRSSALRRAASARSRATRRPLGDRQSRDLHRAARGPRQAGRECLQVPADRQAQGRPCPASGARLASLRMAPPGRSPFSSAPRGRPRGSPPAIRSGTSNRGYFGRGAAPPSVARAGAPSGASRTTRASRSRARAVAR